MTKTQLVDDILDRYGRTFARECGFDVRDAPGPLFRLLIGAMLAGAPVRAAAAARAARALFEEGLTSAQKMRAATQPSRLRVLRAAGYPRFTVRAAKTTGAASQTLLDEYGGDVRELRAAAAGDPSRLRGLLKRLDGIGDTAADVFLSEVQGVWSECMPFASERALEAAGTIGLPASAAKLRALVGDEEMPRLCAALVRWSAAGDVRRTARAR